MTVYIDVCHSFIKLKAPCSRGDALYENVFTGACCAHNTRVFVYLDAEGLMLAGATVKRDAWTSDTMSSIDGAFERASGLPLSSEDLDARDWRIVR